jgi:hypothetical protein
MTMGAYTQATLEGFAEATGIKPAVGHRAEILRQMSDAAFELIKMVELERSGIRDGDGFWHGGDVLGATMSEWRGLIDAFEATYRDQPLIDPEVLRFLGLKKHPLANMKVGDATRADRTNAALLLAEADAVKRRAATADADPFSRYRKSPKAKRT